MLRFTTRSVTMLVMSLALLSALAAPGGNFNTAAIMLGAAGITTSAQDETSSTPAVAVTREVINEGYPDAAPGQVLQLVRYTIPPNMLLPVHIHPGMQVVVVESGTLHFTVLEGRVEITRGATAGTSAAREELTSGQETDFGPGDRFVEAAGMVHFGENRTGEPVVLLVASLFEADVPPSTLVEVSPVATPAGGSSAQEATPVIPIIGEDSTIFTLVERPEQVTILDLGAPGKSAGDVTVWGPNPLYDEANAVDTGALTHGSCISLNTAGDNHCMETVLFADGSTLDIQGIQHGSGEPSLTTIVGGSGTYRGATGTVVVDPSADYRTWTKTFEVVMPANTSIQESSGSSVSRVAQ
jgi:hypothetical protein